MKRKLFAVSMAAAMATSCFAGTAFASDSEPVTIKVTRACFNLANPDSEQVKKFRMLSMSILRIRSMFRSN